MVLKFSQQMKHAQRTEKYIRLIFNSYISDDNFFQKSMCIIDTNQFFSGDFQGQEGVRIMHQCALCNPKYGRFWNCSDRVVFFLFFFCNLSVRFWNCSDRVVFFYSVSTIYQLDFGTVQTEWYFFNLFLQFISQILELFRQSGIF